jgi:penicillin G amidase
MWRSVLLALAASIACRSRTPAPAPLVPQTSGSIAVSGLAAPVRVVRDRWGVPHVYAANTRDLFVAQGFVQAQDRLFQMDLWRRASQGRLAEILGANFVERDTMTRRIQYQGDPDADWTSYGPEARAIAEAFVRGINACVSLARERPPEEFAIAGWPPSYWSADDLRNRTDAFVMSGDAIEEVRRSGLPDVVADAVRLVGTPPFFIGAAPSDAATRSNAASRAAASVSLVETAEARRRLTAPSPRYVVHLVAPGWNVIGATAPWLPGVVIGHNDRVAWGMSPIDVDTQNLSVETLDPAAMTVSRSLMRIKGRPEMMSVAREATPHGVVIATDRARNRVFTIRWTGFDPGGAAELGALAIDRARSAADFRSALAHWKLPARRVVFADVDGGSGSQDVPRREITPSAPATARRELVEGRADGMAIFAHVLGVGGRLRFNVGPVMRPRDDAPLRMTIDPRGWDRSRAINAPGQSGSPASPHYADAAKPWSAGESFELWFSEEGVRANADATLMLIPRR